MKKYNEDVSVLLITLNNASDIDRVLSSILKSNPGQLIISDGGSSDETVELSKKYTSDVYVGVKGRSNQINLGLTKATGKFIIFIEGDHEYSENFISELKDEFQSSDFFGLQATLECQLKNNFFEKGIAQVYKIHQCKKGQKKMIGGPSIFNRENYLAHFSNLNALGYSADTELGEILKRKNLKVGLGHTVAFQHQVLDYKIFFNKYFNYGKGDYEFYKSHRKQWTTRRKLKSIFHVFNRHVIDYPAKSFSVGKPHIAIPYLWASAVIRYYGWVYSLICNIGK